MFRLAVAISVALIAFQAEARPRRQQSSVQYSAAGDTSTAQGVAEIQARLGRVGHFGGNSGYEGCGSGSTPEQALNNCCYSNSGMPVYDQGVAFGNGRWFACRRYGR